MVSILEKKSMLVWCVVYNLSLKYFLLVKMLFKINDLIIYNCESFLVVHNCTIPPENLVIKKIFTKKYMFKWLQPKFPSGIVQLWTQ